MMARPALDPGEKAVRVGAKLFARKSYAATTTRELAKALGMTNGAFYHYFPTKEDLLLAICEESLGRIIRAAKDSLVGIEDDSERLRALITGHVESMLRDQALHRTMLIELRSLSPTNLQRVLQLRADYGNFVKATIAAAGEDGALRKDIDSEMLTLMLLNLLNWTIFWFDRRGKLSADEIAALVTTMFFDGAGP
jgi:TetR/AcrR family transcriptional regulator, cholesterol catabolism regulator